MLLHRLDLRLRQAQDIVVVGALVRRAERDGRPLETGAARPPDAVDVRLRHLGNIKVDDVRQLLDVDPARGNVRRDKDAAAPLLEGGQRRLTGVLRFVAVDRLRGEAGTRQIARHAVSAVLRPREDEHGDELRVFQQPREEAALVLAVDEIDVLADGLHRRRGRRDLHDRHVVQQTVGDFLNLRRHRGGEQERLLLLRRFVDDAPHVVDEAHVEHPVGLVEDENLERVEAHKALPDEIVEPPRRRDEDVHAVFERGHLRRLPHAAEDHGGAQAEVSAIQLEVFIVLQGELARRRQNEGADRPLPLRDPAPREQLQNRHGERRRLARPRLGAAEQIPPLQHRGNRGLLNRRRLLVARLAQRPKNRRNNVELFKRHTIHPNFIIVSSPRLCLPIFCFI